MMIFNEKYVKKLLSLLLVFTLTVSVGGVCVSAVSEGTEPAAAASAEGVKPAEAEEKAPEQTNAETTPSEPAETVPAPTEAAKKENKSDKTAAKKSGVFLDVPKYLQTDYPKCVYGTGTVATSGCSMTSAAMVITYLTGETVMPDELAVRFREDDGSNLQRMEYTYLVYDLEFTKTFSWNDVVKALSKGKVVTILVNSRSPFTSTQHFMVLTGITSDGKIMLNDPYGPNYEKWELKDGYENGFDQSVVLQGFSGAWIFEEYKEPEFPECRYPDFDLSQDDRNLLAKIIWLEARGESFEGQRAVAEVVFNRMMSDDFKTDTVRGTIMAENQFRTVDFLDQAKPGELQYKAIDRALSGPYVLPEDVFFFASYPVNKNVWGRIGGHIFCGSFDTPDAKNS